MGAQEADPVPAGSEDFWGLAAATTQKSPCPTGAAALLTPAVRNGILGQKKKKWIFLFLYKWKQNPGKAATPPL